MVKSGTVYTRPVIRGKKRELNEFARKAAKSHLEAKAQEKLGRVAQLTPPVDKETGEPHVFRTDLYLLFNAYNLWIQSGKQIIPDPDLIERLPLGYISDILNLDTLIQWHIDMPQFNAGYRNKK